MKVTLATLTTVFYLQICPKISQLLMLLEMALLSLFFFVHIMFMSMDVLPACMSMYYAHAVPLETRKGQKIRVELLML